MSNNGYANSNQFFLWLYRGLGVVGILSVLVTQNMGTVVKFDPLWLRLLMATVLLLAVSGTFLSEKFVKRIPAPLLITCILLTAFWALLCFSNDFSRWYFFGYLGTLTCCATILYDIRAYIVFFSINFILSLTLIPLLETPEFRLQGFMASFALILILSLMGLVSGIRKRKESEEKENLLLTINQASFQESNAAILVTDTEGTPIHFNDEYLRTWQLTKPQIEGPNAADGLRTADALFKDPEIARSALERTQKEPKVVIDSMIELKDGRFLQRVSRPLFRKEKHLGRIWFYHDISELKQEEIRLEKVRQQLALQNKMMLELAGSDAIRDGDLEEVFRQITGSIATILEVESAGIWMLSEDHKSLECKYGQMRGEEYMPSSEKVTAEAHENYFAALETNRILSGPSLIHEGWSSLDAPIRSKGEVVGMICAGMPDSSMEWDTNAANLLNSMCDLVAVTLETMERRKVEKELRNSLAIQEAIFDLSGLGILVTTQDRGIISYNEFYLSIWNLDKEFLEEESADVVIGYCQAQLSNAALLRNSMKFLGDNPDQDQFDFLEFKDGRIMERFTSVLEVDEQFLGRVWFFRDISDRIETEQRLRTTERRNKAILNALPDLMLRIDTAGKVLDVKVPETEIFPQVQPEIIGQSLREIFPQEFVLMILENIGLAQQSGETSAFEIEINLTGQERDYEARLVPSNPDELLLIIRDVTERKRSEKELVQRNYELDSFVYRASHDLKAPLNSLMGLIDIVRNETEDGNVLSYLGLMDKSVVKLDTFIRNLTDFSRINRLEIQYEKVDFEQMVNEITDSLQYMEKSERVEKIVQMEAGPGLYADSFHIGIALGNLISNAIKYQDLKKDAPFVEVSVNVNEKQAVIVVADNGVGIPLEYQDRIFELFFRASNQSFGSGLGLYITRNAVEKMAGKITFESSPESGTRFTVTIPNRIEHVMHLQGMSN